MMVATLRNRVRRYNRSHMTLTMFNVKGSPFGHGRKRHLRWEKYKAVHIHVLRNCTEVLVSCTARPTLITISNLHCIRDFQ